MENYNDDSFWELCQQGGRITPGDLGISTSQSTEGICSITEGCTTLQHSFGGESNLKK